MMRRLISALAMGLALPAAAQDAAAVDYDPGLLTTCLARSGGESCIGRASDACMGTPAGQTTLGMRECLGLETAQWDEMLNAAYRDLTTQPGERANALKKAQRAWIAFVAAACVYEAGAYEGGTMAGIATGSCRLRETARRALDLQGYLVNEAAQ